MLDCFSRFVWARLYTSRMWVSAVQILNNHTLPFFEEHDVKVQAILSDNGREYGGRLFCSTSSRRSRVPARIFIGQRVLFRDNHKATSAATSSRVA